MTHNDNIRTFDDIQRHLKLEDDCLEVAKASSQLYVFDSTLRNTRGNKCKRDRSSIRMDKILIS